MNNLTTNTTAMIKIARIINPITERIEEKISGRNFASSAIPPMIHKTTSKATIKSPLFTFYEY